MLPVFFWGFSGVAVISALLCVTRKSPVASALWLVGTMFALAALYLTLHAQFIAVIQVLVYAGAIMVLFLFVIMLLNLGDEQRLAEKISFRKILAAGLGVGLLLELLYIVGFIDVPMPEGDFSKGVDIGTVEYIGKEL